MTPLLCQEGLKQDLTQPKPIISPRTQDEGLRSSGWSPKWGAASTKPLTVTETPEVGTKPSFTNAKKSFSAPQNPVCCGSCTLELAEDVENLLPCDCCVRVATSLLLGMLFNVSSQTALLLGLLFIFFLNFPAVGYALSFLLCTTKWEESRAELPPRV